MGIFLFRVLRLALSPFFLTIAFGLLFGAWLVWGNRILTYNNESTVAKDRLEEIIGLNPAKAELLGDPQSQPSMLVAALSATMDHRERATLKDMVDEVAAVNQLPYRARFAQIAIDQQTLRDDEKRAAFFLSHATACESLAESGNWQQVQDYATELELAAKNTKVWPLVFDDPLGLMIWSETQDPSGKLLAFYHRNRDWLADPLAAIDLGEVEGEWTIQAVLESLEKHEKCTNAAITKGEVGVYGIAVMLTHGALVDLCWSRYKIPPAEVISVILFNRDLLDEREGNSEWVGEQATWLDSIRRQHPTVWFAATETPLALKLHQDAPNVSDALLERYGGEDIAALIYSNFSDHATAAAAAEAIDKFGDLAIYVFAKYHAPEFVSEVGRYLIDPEVGIRVVPFIVRFGDRAFDKLEESRDWVDRYFEADGTSRVDSFEWVDSVPGGAAVRVVRNWKNGYPSEWSELGWATIDVADAALAVASLGSTKIATTTASIASRGARLGSQSTKFATAGARATKNSRWLKSLQEFRSLRLRSLPRSTRVAKMARVARLAIDPAKRAIWGTIKLSESSVRLAGHGLSRTISTWKGLSQSKKIWVYRGVLGASVYLTWKYRTQPNLDKIAQGIATNLRDAIAGTIKLVGDSLLSSFHAIVDSKTGFVVRSVHLFIAALLLLVTVRMLRKVKRQSAFLLGAKP